MKKIFILFALITTLCKAQIYIGSHKLVVDLDDKTEHILAGAFISSSSQFVTYTIMKHKNIMLSGYIGNSVGFMAGLGKEVYDSRPGGSGFDPLDLMATSYGSFMGNLVCSVGIDCVDNRKRIKHPELYQNLNTTTP